MLLCWDAHITAHSCVSSQNLWTFKSCKNLLELYAFTHVCEVKFLTRSFSLSVSRIAQKVTNTFGRRYVDCKLFGRRKSWLTFLHFPLQRLKNITVQKALWDLLCCRWRHAQRCVRIFGESVRSDECHLGHCSLYLSVSGLSFSVSFITELPVI